MSKSIIGTVVAIGEVSRTAKDKPRLEVFVTAEGTGVRAYAYNKELAQKLAVGARVLVGVESVDSVDEVTGEHETRQWCAINAILPAEGAKPDFGGWDG